MSEPCFLCKTENSTIKYNIYNTYTKTSGNLLNKYIEKVLNQRLTFNSRIICCDCYDLVEELDLAEKKVTEVREKLYKYFNCKTINKTNDVYCQTDSNEEESNVNVQSKMKAMKQENLMKNTYNLHENACQVNQILNNTQEENINIDGNNKEIEELVLKTDNELNSYKIEVENANPRKARGRKKKFPGVLKPHKCSECAKSWKTLGELKTHMLSHDDSKPFICEICGQAYKHKTALNVHIGMHNGINPFTCLYCNKSFTQKGALQRHIPIHTGETPYQCELCGKVFVHHTSFNIHKLSHTGQKSYKCNLCDLALLSGSHLKRHMRVHTGERKYVCPICDKRFAERYNLVTHQKLHEHPGNSSSRNTKRNHRCPECGKSFDRKIKLDEHIVNDHQKCNSNNIPIYTNKNNEWLHSNYEVKEESMSF